MPLARVGGLAAKIFGKSAGVIAPALKGAMGAVKDSLVGFRSLVPGCSNRIFVVW